MCKYKTLSMHHYHKKPSKFMRKVYGWLILILFALAIFVVIDNVFGTLDAAIIITYSVSFVVFAFGIGLLIVQAVRWIIE